MTGHISDWGQNPLTEFVLVGQIPLVSQTRRTLAHKERLAHETKNPLASLSSGQKMLANFVHPEQQLSGHNLL